MIARISLATLSALLAAPGAFAQSLPSGIDTRGYAELSYIDFGGGSDGETFLQSDFDIMIGPEALGFGLPIGFDFGLLGIRDDEDGFEAYYAALTYDFGSAGKISLGAPRPVYDSYVRGRLGERFGPIGAGELSLILFRSLSTIAALSEEETAYGLRYDGEFGNLSFGASYTRLTEGGDDLDTVGIGGAYTFGDWRVEAAFENSQTDGSGLDANSAKIGIGADYGTYAFGLNYTSFEAPGELDVWELYGIYRPTDRIEIEALMVDISEFDDSLYGLAGQYKFWRDAYGEIGVLSDGDDEVYQVSLGWQF